MTNVIDAYCSMVAYAGHLTPILDALPEDRRGHLFVPTNLRHQMPEGSRFDVVTMSASSAPVLIAGYQDLPQGGRRPKVHVNHGAGQTYAEMPDHPSYDGGAGRDGVDLFLCPNQLSADRNLARYPNARAAVVGCPKLDAYLRIPKPHNDPPVVAVAFHWNCGVSPESGWAWPTWHEAIAELSKSMTVLGHGHPRARQELEPWYASVGIESVWSVEELLARADCFVIDNSSLAYEVAAVDRPVVFIRDRSWRDEARHGLRFGDELPGIQLWTYGDSPDAASILETFITSEIDCPLARRARKRVAERAYGPVDGKASARAAAAILAYEEGR